MEEHPLHATATGTQLQEQSDEATQCHLRSTRSTRGKTEILCDHRPACQA